MQTRDQGAGARSTRALDWRPSGPHGQAVVSDGELFTAKNCADLVHMLRCTVKFGANPPKDDKEYMQQVSARGGIRCDTPENFIYDMRDAGVIELLKREYRLV